MRSPPNLMRRGLLLLAFAGTMLSRAATVGTIEELGIPVRGVGWVRLHPGIGPNGDASLLISMGQHKDGLFVLDVDLATGHCRQYRVGRDEAALASSSFRSQRTGVLYVGSAYTGHLHRYDPAHPERGLEDLGPVPRVVVGCDEEQVLRARPGSAVGGERHCSG